MVDGARGGSEVYTLGYLAQFVSGHLEGPQDQTVRGVAPVADATEDELTFASDAKTVEAARQSRAVAVIVAHDAPDIGKRVIRVDNPRLAFARILQLFAPEHEAPVAIASTAKVAPDAELGDGVAVGEYAQIGPRTQIGANVVVYPGVYIGADVVVGAGTVIYPHVTLLDRVHIGRNVTLHPGVVVGSDGFGYVPVDGAHYKVPQIGTVVIEDDVEIGVNAAVARATMGVTRIGRGTKIDGHVYVAHNVQLGADVIIAGMSALAGSAVVEDRVTLAGQTGVAGHLTVGAGAVVGARGLVIADVAPGAFVSGSPVRPHRENMRIVAAEGRLPQLLKTVARLEQRVAQLERRLRNDGAEPR